GGPQHDTDRKIDVVDARVVFLTHYLPLYQVQVLKAIASRVRDFQVLLSTPIEPNRDFELDWGGLDVTVQRAITFRRSWRHRDADQRVRFTDPLFVHVPIDTQSQLRRRRPDIVMSLELGARSLGAVRYCRRHSAKSILCTYMSEHTERHRGRLRSLLRRYLVRRADAITYNGPSCRDYLRAIGVADEKLYRLAYAADDRTAHSSEVSRNDSLTRSKLLYVGQLSDRKGILPLIEQLSRYCINRRSRRVVLRVVGEGPLRQSVADAKTPENFEIQMLGSLAPSRLRQEMAACGASVAPTLADEWLLVANESLHAGLPVIGSRYAQAVTTLIRQDENGWVYDPVIEGSLDEALDRYFELSEMEMQHLWKRCRRSIEHCTPTWAAAGAVEAVARLVRKEVPS
ncbi:MAG: glycosyltransferase family 4 protein, partial [Planctomycetota bacterium]